MLLDYTATACAVSSGALRARKPTEQPAWKRTHAGCLLHCSLRACTHASAMLPCHGTGHASQPVGAFAHRTNPRRSRMRAGSLWTCKDECTRTGSMHTRTHAHISAHTAFARTPLACLCKHQARTGAATHRCSRPGRATLCTGPSCATH